MFLRNKNIIFKIRRSKVTDYAALKTELLTMLMTSLAHNADAMGSIKVKVEVKFYLITQLNY